MLRNWNASWDFVTRDRHRDWTDFCIGRRTKRGPRSTELLTSGGRNGSRHRRMTTNQEQAALQEQIETHPFLRGMRPEHLALLTDCAMATSFAPNELIFRQGEFANR